MPLNDFVQVNITTQAVAPSQQSFGVPLILGSCINALAAFGASLLRVYTSLAGMVSDGFAATDPEYLAAQALFSQSPTLPQLVVGRRTNKPTQKHALTVLSGADSTWATSTAYTLGKKVVLGGNLYICTTAGTSAESGGPTGTGSGITDNTAVWAYVRPNAGTVYTATINGVAKSYTSSATDKNSDIATALATAIGTPTGFGAASASAAVVTLTASAAGNWCRVAATNPNVDLDHQQTHVDAGVVADLTAILNVDGGSSWYTVTATTSSNAEVAALAAYVETIGKLYLADSNDSTILGSGSSDIASTLIASAYVRSPIFYHPDSGAFLGAASAGKALPLSPGGGIWKFLQPSGVATTSFSASQLTNLKAKLANWLYTVAGVNIVANGTVPANEWIDTVRDRDWLASTIQTDFFNALLSPPSAVNQANPGNQVPALGKIPYTDPGIAVMEGVLRCSLQKGVNQNVLAATPPPTVTAPLAASISPSVKATRALTLAWGAELAGAIQSLTLNGSLSF